jgi:hypothetical protein
MVIVGPAADSELDADPPVMAAGALELAAGGAELPQPAAMAPTESRVPMSKPILVMMSPIRRSPPHMDTVAERIRFDVRGTQDDVR